MRKSIVTVLAALSASFAIPASAKEVSVAVTFHDLDLTKPADLATLEGRIAVAVEEVCDKVEPRYFQSEMAWKECKARSLADAMEQLAAIAPQAEVALAAAIEN